MPYLSCGEKDAHGNAIMARRPLDVCLRSPMQEFAQVTSASRLRLSVCSDWVASLFRPLMSMRLTTLAEMSLAQAIGEATHCAPAPPQAISLFDRRGEECQSELDIIEPAILVVSGLVIAASAGGAFPLSM